MIVTAYKTDPRIMKKLPTNPRNTGVPIAYLQRMIIITNIESNHFTQVSKISIRITADLYHIFSKAKYFL